MTLPKFLLLSQRTLGGKGLRHFSMKVCEKVQAKGSTSYNEVADELVNELTDPRCTSPTDQQYDQVSYKLPHNYTCTIMIPFINFI